MSSVPGSGTVYAPTGSNINTVQGSLTNPPPPSSVPGAVNLEVFTFTSLPLPSPLSIDSVTGLIDGFTLPTGYQGAVFFIPGATELVSNGSFGFNAAGNQAVLIADPAASVTVTGSAGDTITGAPTADVTQLIDASGTAKGTTPGPMTIIGGAGATTVWGGAGDSITGGAGAILVAGDLAKGQTIVGGSGSLTAFDLGTKDSITGSTSGFTFIDDNYGGGGNTIVGGAGTGTVTTPLGTTVAAGTFIVGGVGDSITGGSGTMLVNALNGSMTINGGVGASTIWGAPGDVVVGGSGPMQVSGNGTSVSPLSITDGSGNLYVIGGTNDSVTGGGGSTTVAGGSAATVKGGIGNLQVDSVSGSSVTGGSGNLSALNLGTGNTIVGSTTNTTFIDDSYTSTNTGAFTGGTNTLTGGTGNSTIVAGPNDSINGGAGALLVQIHSSLNASETVNLSTGGLVTRGADSVADLNDTTGTGAKVTVSGFNTTTDQIVSAQSAPSNVFIGTSASDGKGGTILTFKDGSTMDIVGVASVGSIKFIS